MSDRLRELLLKAVRTLEPEEQDEVLGELLLGSAAAAAVTTVGPAHAVTAAHLFPLRMRGFDRAAFAEQLTTTLGVASGDLKLLPVRLPAADYERLRAWSKEHAFSMAVIIRTLVERFLDGQEGTGPRAEPES